VWRFEGTEVLRGGAAHYLPVPWGVRVSPMPIPADLLAILACPVDHAPLREEQERLVCGNCGRRYPVRDGIPVLLADQAEQPAR
jgi:uncharacterized protein YbaR (Trm112 family)